MTAELSAESFIERMTALASSERATQAQRYFKTGVGEYGEGDVFIGVRMGQVAALAKEFIDLPPDEIEKLLDSPVHEVRSGAVSIMRQQANRKKTPASRKRELFDLYLRRHDRINNWDLVDLGARDIVGSYLFDQPRDLLYTLVRSENVWERRTAIISTFYFLNKGDQDDLYRLAEMLLDDRHDLIHKATGWALRTAGDQDRQRLLDFLEQHAATMPRTVLRYAIEHLTPEQRAYYMGLKQAKQNP